MGSLQRFGRLVGAPFLTVGRAYNATAKKHPATTGIVTTVLKTSAADLFAQKVIERQEDVDWKRNAVFTGFGFAYLGCFQYYLYNNVFVRWTPGIKAVVGARLAPAVLVFLDQAVHHPLCYFPCFYLMKGFMEDRPPASSLTKCVAEMWENLQSLWMIWVPAQAVNFSMVPLHLRIPFVAGVSFAWTIVLSTLRGALDLSHQQGEQLEHLIQAAEAS